MAQLQKAETVVLPAERSRTAKCRHRHKKYVINEIEFKIWRCSDCGLIHKEE